MVDTRITSGADGLDAVLRGGLPSGSIYLVQGLPGTGKTTLALQFLLAGVARGESVLYITLSQTTRDLERIALSHGWSLDGITVVELQSETGPGEGSQGIFQTTDLRLDATRRAVEEVIVAHDPKRMVYDSLLEVRLLAPDISRYQREMVGLRTFVSGRDMTVMLLDTALDRDTDDSQSLGIVHGVITLDKTLPTFGRARRRIEVAKMRGVDIYDGWHDMDIRTGEGVSVFPRLAPREKMERLEGGDLIRSGRERLDAMFGGGMEPGTTTMVIGQAGSGKSTIASLYATAALERGEKVALFLFEERVETFFRRSEGLGMDLREHHESGLLKIYDYNPGEITAGEFCQIVQREADADDLRVVVIDSFTGYMSVLGNEDQALFDIQALLKHLAHRQVLTILIVAQHGLLGQNADVRLDLSFLGDTVLLLRMREVEGRIYRDLIAVKKRHGPHELDVRRLVIETGYVDVSEEDR